ncbi:dienelactone hydrolase [Pedobacter sp. AK017]|uniref:alpha/beta hydrolase family protein n=1 Tax=Pedobacter sp. AK017 TaxID=2723073 RepID=UPI00161C19D2|nr:prolyl oligopeptidase family serine peptidase [Pedobacter sp. AK017]MBB5438001.1 dienelactone hydrolase [Pedobacter sp. AK017]
MKKVILLASILLSFVYSIAQNKTIIDVGQFENWPSLIPSESGVAVSKNGNYAAYVILHQPVGQSTLVVQDLNSKWKKTIIAKTLKILFFTDDSQKLCWQQRDSIWTQRMGSDQKRLLGISSSLSYPNDAKGKWVLLSLSKTDSEVRLYNLLSDKGRIFSGIKDHHWLTGGNGLLLKTSDGDLKVLNLMTGKEQIFNEVKEYALSSDEKSIALVIKKRNTNKTSLQLVKLGGNPITVWEGKGGEEAGNFVFDKTGKQLAFTVQSSDGKINIWHYSSNKKSTTVKIDEKAIGFSENLPVSGIRGFSGNGHWLFFMVKKQLPLLSKEAATSLVDIWTYRDEVLNPAQTHEGQNFHDYLAVINLTNDKVQMLENEPDEEIGPIYDGNYIFLKTGGNSAGSWWPHSKPAENWLVSLANGERKLMKNQQSSFSPQERWIYWWDPKLGHYFSMNPITGKTSNLTESVPESVVDDVEQAIGAIPLGIIGWYADDSAVLIYDNYDIWKLDPSGFKTPVNMTGGYGKQHGVKLRLVYDHHQAYNGNEELLLSGLDVNSQYNGFFRIRLDKPGKPALLTMGPYNYYQTTVTKQGFGFNPPMIPLVAGKKGKECWIVMRESAVDYPNLYISKDLKQFTPLTNLKPQKTYNWLSSEAVSWRMYNGQLNHGVLYKPENFDPNRKYPIIFNYYEKYAQRCYQFPKPSLTTDNINIPWFVSHGYLVFTPDIQYTIANKPGGMTTGEAAYNAVASAAEYLSKRSYIDKTRMAIQGHSFGGGETNNIITHTSLFAAAAEMAGYSDNISAYLTLVGGFLNREYKDGVLVEKLHKMDHPQGRMGANPWERPDLYQRNSPVRNADKITTPLFIVHNQKDATINFRQGVEMYMALRRLGKTCWLLQYDNSGHYLENKKDALDYTTRLTQFFDHYLKGEPAPQWMTMNTLASYKGKNNLYELDPRGNCGKDCKVCREWNSKTSTTNLKTHE